MHVKQSRRYSSAGQVHRHHRPSQSPLFEWYGLTDRRARVHLFAGEQPLPVTSRLEQIRQAFEASRE